MRTSWMICGALLVVALVCTHVSANPVQEPVKFSNYEEQESNPEGSKTWHAIKTFFNPMTNYFKGLPEKTPSDVAGDVKDKVTDIKQWAADNEAIQTLMSALGPVRSWVTEKRDALKDKSFSDMYDSVKQQVSDLDNKIGGWIQEQNSKSL